MNCNQILNDLDNSIVLFEENQRLFLESRDLFDKESMKIEDLRPTFNTFDGLYSKFRDNVTDIVSAKKGLEDLNRMKRRGEISEETYLMKCRTYNTTIVDSCKVTAEDIFPKLRNLAKNFSIDSASKASNKSKEEFKVEKEEIINGVERKLENTGAIEKLKPYLKELFPALIRTAVKLVIA